MRNPKFTRKGQTGLNALPAVVIALVVGFVTLSIGALVMTGVQDNDISAICIVGDNNANCTAAYNASDAGLLALLSIADFGSTMGVIAAAAILLSLIGGLAFFVGRRQ